jgi:hypothetical protein
MVIGEQAVEFLLLELLYPTVLPVVEDTARFFYTTAQVNMEATWGTS